MAKRKTIHVERVKELVNKYLLNSKDENKDIRFGNAILLEQILHETGNYRGFGYLNAQHMADSQLGSTIGVNTTPERPAETQTHEELFKGTDDSRRFYY